MKKLFSIALLASFLLMAGAITAQNSTSRFASDATKGNNTGSALTLTSATKLISGAVDTVKINPNASQSYYTFDTTSTQSTLVALKVKMYTTNARRWDCVNIVVNSDTAKVLTFISGTNFKTGVNGTLTVQRTQKAYIGFIFDGICWSEKYRTIVTKP